MLDISEDDLPRRVDGDTLPHEDHPELHHYTDENGLKGILKNNELWATQYKHLNDSTEFLQLNDILVPILESRLCLLIDELFKRGGSQYLIRATKNQSRTSLAKQQAKATVEVFHQVTFKGGRRPFPFADPFVTSFCSHADDEEYEQKNGLLSQWNRYGGEAGFAIVFDTLLLSPFLKKEAVSHPYSFVTMLDVVYNSKRQNLSEKFKNLTDQLVNLVKSNLVAGKLDGALIFPIYDPYVHACARLKHQAFHEEREVRIIVSPNTQEFLQVIRKEEPDTVIPNVPVKEILYRGDDKKIPYIRLFDFEEKQALPIRRIIVGPHREQDNLVSMVRGLCSNRYPVVASATPFLKKR